MSRVEHMLVRPPLSPDDVLRPETICTYASLSFAKWTLPGFNDEEVALVQEAVTAWLAVRQGVFKRDGGRCAYCGKGFRRFSKSVHIDHVIPRAQGGNDLPDNLVVSCASCNLSKGGRTPAEWGGRVTVARPVKPKRKSRKGLGVACPTCAAAKGARCLGRRGKPRIAMHRDRLAKTRGAAA